MRLFNQNTEKHFYETTRIMAFSDGVFSIAITLLVLHLIETLQHVGDQDLLHLMFGHWQSFLAFTVGFLTILVCWINHHLVFTCIKKADGTLMWVNGFVLLLVTFTPLPTAILAEYISKEPHLAVAIFGVNYVLMSVAAYFITAYPLKNSLIDPDDREMMNYIRMLYCCSIVYTLLILPICFVFVPLAIFFYCILFIVFAFPRMWALQIFLRMRRKSEVEIHESSNSGTSL